jgi:hypothetical protein
MAPVPAMLRLTLVALLAAWGQCAHEWHRKHVGAVHHAALDGRHVLVSTASGVLASLDSRSGGVGASAEVDLANPAALCSPLWLTPRTRHTLLPLCLFRGYPPRVACGPGGRARGGERVFWWGRRSDSLTRGPPPSLGHPGAWHCQCSPLHTHADAYPRAPGVPFVRLAGPWCGTPSWRRRLRPGAPHRTCCSCSRRAGRSRTTRHWWWPPALVWR